MNRSIILLSVLISVPALCGQESASGQKPAWLAAAAYSAEQEGLIVLIQHKGKTVFEQLQNGYKGKAHHIYSGTKSFVPIVALVAEAEGMLDLDEPVAKTIEEWADDERKKRITIRQLLSFTSGLDPKLDYRARDLYQASIDVKAISDPGKRFRYGSTHLMVFGELMKRKLAARAAASTAVAEASDSGKNGKPEKKAPRDFVDYLTVKILDPIGCKHGFWLRDGKKNPALPYGAFITAGEWAKFGQLVLHGGSFDGKQIVPKKRLAECFVGTKANPTYGLNFWLIGNAAHRKNQEIPKDVVTAAGMYNQKLYIIPSKDMVIVRYGKIRARTRYNDAEFLGRLFGGAGKGR